MSEFLAYHPTIGIFVPDFINREGYATGHNDDGVCVMTKDVMKWSGCIDCKAKPIHEGHILLAYSKHWRVFFSSGSFWAKHGRERRLLRNMYCEVVGNVFQNRKLLIDNLTKEG